MSAILPVRRVEKPWGREELPAPFSGTSGQRTGEIWFEPPPLLDDLLAKYIFTSDRLSVQVHPPGTEGKEECWLVVDAQPGATLGIGFREPIGAEEMRAAALDGSIEHLLAWHPVSAGDYAYIPAGTVHAIGAGVSLVEIQQNNDITYRLYDYGRPRELHLDEALAVAVGDRHDPALRRSLPDNGHVAMVDGPWFRLDRTDGLPDASMHDRYAQGALLVLPLNGTLTVAGEEISAGQCAVASDIRSLAIPPAVQCLLAQPVRPGE